MVIEARFVTSAGEAESELRMFGRDEYAVAFVEQVGDGQFLLHDDGERGPARFTSWPEAVAELPRRVSEDVGMLLPPWTRRASLWSRSNGKRDRPPLPAQVPACRILRLVQTR